MNSTTTLPIASIEIEEQQRRLRLTLLHQELYGELRYVWSTPDGTLLPDCAGQTRDDAEQRLLDAYRLPGWGLHLEGEDYPRETILRETAVQSLDDLLTVLREDDGTDEYAERHGLPTHPAERGIDWTSLPTFGGATPADTHGIWSWDETRLLVGESQNEIDLVPRAEWED